MTNPAGTFALNRAENGFRSGFSFVRVFNEMKPIETGSTFRPGVIGIAGLYVALAAFVFFLAFCNLDGRPFWGDEAETALLARNVLKFGVPRVNDGVNHISLHGDRFDARDGVGRGRRGCSTISRRLRSQSLDRSHGPGARHSRSLAVCLSFCSPLL